MDQKGAEHPAEQTHKLEVEDKAVGRAEDRAVWMVENTIEGMEAASVELWVQQLQL